MKYLVNRKTKVHVIAPDDHIERFSAQWDIIQADPEGWIPHTGDECPLPDDVRCDLIDADGWKALRVPSGNIIWSLNHRYYRPIFDDKVAKDAGMSQSEAYQNQCRRLGFDDKVQEPDYDPRSVSFNVIDRLRAAHQAASDIPDLVAELRQALEPMGLGVMYLSQFDEVEP